MAGILAQILFMVFLRLIAEYIHRDGLAARARSILQWAIVFGVIYLLSAGVGFVAALMKSPPLALLSALGMLIAGVAFLVLIITYVIFLNRMRKALYIYADALAQSQTELESID